MVPKYATQFTVLDRETRRRPAISAIERCVHEWVESIEKEGVAPEGCQTFTSGASYESATEIVGIEEQWAARYSRPDRSGEVQWIRDIGVAVSDTTTSVSLSVGVSLPQSWAFQIRRGAELEHVQPSRERWMEHEVAAGFGPP